jgi:hypothetical protein
MFKVGNLFKVGTGKPEENLVGKTDTTPELSRISQVLKLSSLKQPDILPENARRLLRSQL